MISNFRYLPQFRRFLSDLVFNDEDECNEYYERFAEQSLNDIRLLEHFDAETLIHDIGINKIKVKLFLQQIEQWKKDCIAVTLQSAVLYLLQF